MAYEFITSETSDRITTITINRPEVMNALHPPASGELGQAFDAFRDDDDAWVAIITGAVWSANARAFYWLSSGMETFALLSWSILAVILFARLVRGCRGRKAAYLTIVAFLAVLARVLGLTL